MEDAVDSALRMKLTTVSSIRSYLATTSGHGVQLLRSVIGGDAIGVHNRLERQFHELAALAGLPKPIMQGVTGRFRVDFWPPCQLPP